MKLLVISSYPEKNLTHSSKTVGVASYTKNTLLSVKKLDPKLDITVLAEIFDKKCQYKDDADITVRRIWKRGSIFSIAQLLPYALNSGATKILAQFEMFMMGKFLHAGVYSLVLFALKVLGKDITLILHQVVDEVSTFEKNKIKAKLIIIGKKLFYSFLILSSNKIVVFEQELKDRLKGSKKVYVIPHAVESFAENITEEKAKKELKLNANINYVLYFGFLSPYKGVDDLLDLWPSDISRVKLIIAGGLNPNYKNVPEYVNYQNKIVDLCRKKRAIYTDFVPQEKINLYFKAASLLALPYRTFISSSGPLSIGLSFNLPFLISPNLDPYFKTNDFAEGLKRFNIKKEDLLLPSTSKALKDTIEKIFSDYQKYQSYSVYLKNQRSWEKISKDYLNLIEK